MINITTKKAPEALGPYSQAVVENNQCFVSMQLPINPEGGTIAKEIKEQANQVMKNIKNILEEAGFKLENVVKATLYITDLNHFVVINDIYAKYFAHKPARSLVVQAAMPKGAKVALDVIAIKQ